MANMVIAMIFEEPEDNETLGALIMMAQQMVKEVPQVKIQMARGEAADTIQFFTEAGTLPIEEDLKRELGTEGVYQKKPVRVKAVKWDGTEQCVEKVLDLARQSSDFSAIPAVAFTKAFRTLEIPTLEGVMTANPGDWVICGVKGELYPCKPDIFEETYDAVVEEKNEETTP